MIMNQALQRIAISFVMTATAAFGEYKVAPAGAPPSELAPSIAALMQKTGHKITGPDGSLYCEVWFVEKAPSGIQSTEVDLMWKTAPPGSVTGAIQYHAAGHDRRGQAIKPGVYTMRFSMFPINGDHQGAAPNRDFFVLTPAAQDPDAQPVAKYDDLMKMARKASGTPHPGRLPR
ncbi:MAG: hypothetical protein JJE04_20495 [Acidobacteriia bacterium]|nr:hypothetical protein [Terriglobia bacterium]